MRRLGRTRPDLIAHRGASGYRPEHTLAAYRLAIALGADGIELDLVATRDGVLVARHEPELSRTTDVARRPEFAQRRTTKVVDGGAVSGWFVDDFTLAELRTLRAKERMFGARPDSARFDGRYVVPTLAEILRLAEDESERMGRLVQVFLDLKHPTWFASGGLHLDKLLVSQLDTRLPVVVMAAETGVLRGLRLMTDLPLVQLVEAAGSPYDGAVVGDAGTFRDPTSPVGLSRVAAYADGIGLAKDLVLPRGVDGRTGPPTHVVADAHAAGLGVLVWTLRDENDFMAANFRHGAAPFARGDAVAEYHAFFEAAVDAVVGDHPDTALESRRLWLCEPGPAHSSSGMRIHATT